MRAELIEGPKAIAGLRSQWGELYEADPEANYFLSFDWLFGKPDGAGRYGFVVAASSPESDGYASLLPIRINTEHEGGGFHNELNLCGNYNSDYTGFLCRPGFEKRAIPALAEALRQLNWRRLRMLNFSASEARMELFLNGLPSDLVEVKRLNMVNPDGTDNGICPHARLTDDWDSFLARNLSSNTRQKVRRLLRQIGRDDAYRFSHTTGETLKRDVDTLIRLWSDRWGEIKGKRLGSIQASLRRMLHHAFETNSLFMPMLWHEDRVICIHGIFVDRQKRAYNFYVGARDLTFNGPSVGMALHAHAIRQAIAEGMTKYDFLRGNEAYKYAFGSDEARISSVLVSSQSGKNLGGTLDRRGMNYVKRRSAEFYRTGSMEFARKACSQVLEVEPRHVRSLYLLGLTSGKLGDHKTACRAFSRILSRNPRSLKTWMRLGRAAMASCENWNEAVATYGHLLKRVPDQRQVPAVLGRALVRLGQVDLGAAVLEATVRRKPDDAAARAALAKQSKPGADRVAAERVDADLAFA